MPHQTSYTGHMPCRHRAAVDVFMPGMGRRRAGARRAGGRLFTPSITFFDTMTLHRTCGVRESSAVYARPSWQIIALALGRFLPLFPHQLVVEGVDDSNCRRLLLLWPCRERRPPRLASGQAAHTRSSDHSEFKTP